MTTSLHRDPLMSDLFECFRGFKKLMQRVVTPHELSGTHMQALRVLFLERCSTMSRLTDCMHVSPGASTGIIDRLCRLGLVDRTPHPEDRRVVQVCLTEKGQEFVLALQEEMLHEFNQVRAKLSEAEQEAVSAGLHVLAKAFQASATHPQGE